MKAKSKVTSTKLLPTAADAPGARCNRRWMRSDCQAAESSSLAPAIRKYNVISTKHYERRLQLALHSDHTTLHHDMNELTNKNEKACH